MPIKTNIYGHIPFKISLSASIPKDRDPATITTEETRELCRETLLRYAEGNDCSEILAGSEPELEA